MKLRTEITIQPNPNKIDQHKKVFMIGSCFADNIAQRLERIGVQTLSNPLGALNDPLAIENALHRMVEQRKIERGELFCQGDVWFSYDTHNSFDSNDPQEVVDNINNSLTKGCEAFESADWVVVTLGTTMVYERGGKAVANCHKMPSPEFSRRMMTIKEVVRSLEAIVTMAKGKRVIFTLSPVRCLSDGLEGNMLSKATLRLVMEKVVAAHDKVGYFPSYEIFLDDLRDYRYYGDDLLHPSKVGEDYMWERFVEYCMTREVETDGELFAYLTDARNHLPLHPKSEECTTFCQMMFQKALTLIHKFPENGIAQQLAVFFAHSTSENWYNKTCLAAARQIMRCVDRKMYDDFCKCLNNISLPSNLQLKVKLCRHEGLGDKSELYINLPDGTKDYNIFQYLNVAPSGSGVWQVYLLHSLQHVLPLFWHALYGARQYIFSEDDLVQITTDFEGYPISSLQDKQFDLEPKIFGGGDLYWVECCYWSNFKGLIREGVEVVFQKGKVANIRNFDIKVLYEYNCGILF